MTRDLDELLALARTGDRRAIGRLLTIAERGGPDADALERAAHAVQAAPAGHDVRAGRAHIVGITGAPGAGKSTLTGELARLGAEQGKRVAVLAIDPSSPVSGGAILGDRIRMDDVVAAARDRVFIRSMATRGQRGGLALAVPGAVRALDACGFDIVIVETAGVGQIEIDVVAEADTTVVVLNPGWGDAIQANKAGVMEIADLFVVNKADRPGADDTVRDIEYMLDLGHKGIDSHRPAIVRMVATEARGIDELATALDDHLAHLTATGELAERRHRRLVNEVRTRATHDLDAALVGALAAHSDLLDAVRAGSTAPGDAARALAAALLR